MTSKSIVIRQDDPHTRILKVCSILAVLSLLARSRAIAILTTWGHVSWASVDYMSKWGTWPVGLLPSMQQCTVEKPDHGFCLWMLVAPAPGCRHGNCSPWRCKDWQHTPVLRALG